MVNFFNKLGQGLVNFGAATNDPTQFFQDQLKQQQQESALARLQQGVAPPQFIQEDLRSADPNIRAATQGMVQGDILGGLAAIDPSRAAQLGFAALQPQQQQAQSPLGKLFLDKKYIPEEPFQARLARLTAPEQPLVQIGKEQTELQKARGAARGAFEKKIDETASRAVSLLPKLDVLRDQLDQAGTTGPLTAVANFGTSLANQLGIPLTEEQTRRLASGQAADSIIKDIILEGAKRAGSNPSNRDTRLLEDALASIGKSPEANQKVIDILQAVLERDIELAVIKDESLDLIGREFRQRLRDFGEADFVSDRVKQLQTERAAQQTEKAAQQQVLTPPLVNPVRTAPQIGGQTIRVFNEETGVLE